MRIFLSLTLFIICLGFSCLKEVQQVVKAVVGDKHISKQLPLAKEQWSADGNVQLLFSWCAGSN